MTSTTIAPKQLLDEKPPAYPESPRSERPSEAETAVGDSDPKLEPELSAKTKYGVLGILILSYFIDGE